MSWFAWFRFETGFNADWSVISCAYDTADVLKPVLHKKTAGLLGRLVQHKIPIILNTLINLFWLACLCNKHWFIWRDLFVQDFVLTLFFFWSLSPWLPLLHAVATLHVPLCPQWCSVLWPQRPRRVSPLQPALKLRRTIVAFVMQMDPGCLIHWATKSAPFFFFFCQADCRKAVWPCCVLCNRNNCIVFLHCEAMTLSTMPFWLQPRSRGGITLRNMHFFFLSGKSITDPGFQAWRTSQITQYARMQRGGWK